MSEPKERPILFSGEMVRAILDGRKTQTRRILKKQPIDIIACPNPRRPNGETWVTLDTRDPNHGSIIKCRYGKAGDRLWVRETMGYGWACGAVYMADFDREKGTGRATPNVSQMYFEHFGGKKQSLPSIHMPRWASRITLEITAVRVERLQDITHNDALAEGVPIYQEMGACPNNEARAVARFRYLWDSINAKRGYAWDSNPWVWVISFKRVTP